MDINPGELNKKIEIIITENTQDEDGYPVEKTILVRSTWAKFSRTSGTEIVKAGADFGEIKVRFLIRYTNTPITRKMSIKYAGDIYNISYVNNYEDSNEYIEIWCDIVGLN